VVPQKIIVQKNTSTPDARPGDQMR
jgi:hypothetical protein